MKVKDFIRRTGLYPARMEITPNKTLSDLVVFTDGELNTIMKSAEFFVDRYGRTIEFDGFYNIREVEYKKPKNLFSYGDMEKILGED